jgi:hypothetical protein
VRSERVPQVMRATVERAAERYRTCLTVVSDGVGLRVEGGAPGAVTLAWNDVFSGETGWALERRVGKAWRVARALPADSTRVTLRKGAARPGTTYRLRARFRGNVSEPSTMVTLP